MLQNKNWVNLLNLYFSLKIKILLNTFANLCPCNILKTNNAPTYTTEPFQEYCQQFDITHITGIPYNTQGQYFIERTNGQLKLYLKIKEGE